MSNMSMADWFRLKRTVVDVGVPESHKEAELPPVQLDHARMDRALVGPRYALPSAARSPGEIISFLDALAKDLR